MRILLFTADDEHFKELYSDVLTRYSDYVAGYKNLDEYIGIIDDLEDEDADAISVLEGILKNVPDVKKQIRHGDSLDLDVKLQTAVAQVATGFKDCVVQSTRPFSEYVPYVSLVQEALKVLYGVRLVKS